MSAADELKLPLTSADLSAERLAQLRQLYPEAFTEGKIDFPKLRQLFGEDATEAAERYGLSWSGKSEAIKNIQTLTSATLLPAREESEKFDTTENLIIEGDNLEVLKLLQGGYHGRVKMIYIDPPYNTGGDFIYPDNYKEGLADYLKFSGQVSGEGVKLTTNPETDGRYHSKWLTMMYPRLFLARNLLREDGVIFVSIDDHEVHNLRAVMNEIFGEENFVAELIWQKMDSPSRNAQDRAVSEYHEYLLVFARNRDAVGIEKEERASILDAYPLRLPDGRKARRRQLRKNGKGAHREDRPTMWFPLNTPDGSEVWPVAPEGWEGRWVLSKEEWENRTKQKLTEWIKRDSGWMPYYIEIAPVNPTAPWSTLWTDVDQNRQAKAEFTELMGSGLDFQTPKPVSLISKMLSMGADEEDIILDFFAGSGTTAQAVLELNAQDGGNRKFILVQLPEPTERKDFPTIADITKERVRRVIKKLETEIAAKELKERKEKEGQLLLTERGCPQPQRAGTHESVGSSDAAVASEAAAAEDSRAPDLGFKVFKLSSSNFKVWDAASAPKDAAGLGEQLKLMSHNVVENRGDEALLYELVLKSNLPLTSKITSGKIGGQTFYDVADGALAICLERKITHETLRGIIARKPRGVICLDIAFAGNDQLKTNIVLEMKSHGIEFHTA